MATVPETPTSHENLFASIARTLADTQATAAIIKLHLRPMRFPQTEGGPLRLPFLRRKDGEEHNKFLHQPRMLVKKARSFRFKDYFQSLGLWGSGDEYL